MVCTPTAAALALGDCFTLQGGAYTVWRVRRCDTCEAVVYFPGTFTSAGTYLEYYNESLVGFRDRLSTFAVYVAFNNTGCYNWVWAAGQCTSSPSSWNQTRSNCWGAPTCPMDGCDTEAACVVDNWLTTDDARAVDALVADVVGASVPLHVAGHSAGAMFSVLLGLRAARWGIRSVGVFAGGLYGTDGDPGTQWASLPPVFSASSVWDDVVSDTSTTALEAAVPVGQFVRRATPTCALVPSCEHLALVHAGSYVDAYAVFLEALPYPPPASPPVSPPASSAFRSAYVVLPVLTLVGAAYAAWMRG